MPLWYHRVDDYKWIHGSIRQDLEPDERGVWADLLSLAGLTREPRRGYIERSEGVPYPKKVLVCILNISDELFDRTTTKCVKEGRLQVFEDGTMYITNWSRYNDVESWHKRKQHEQEQKDSRNLAVEKSRETKKSIVKALDSTNLAINRLNTTVHQMKTEIINKDTQQ